MLHNRVLRQVCRYLLAVTVISAALLSSSCSKRDEGLALAETGQKASATLSNMYQTLAKDANDTWELEAFNSALRGIPLTPAAQKSLSAQINALNTRARMAARLSETYGSLKKLASFDASAEVKGSATNLAASLNLPDIPEGPPTSKIAGSLATEIVNWQQSGKLKDGSRLLLKSVQGITDIYKNEIKVYQSFPAERKNKLS